MWSGKGEKELGVPGDEEEGVQQSRNGVEEGGKDSRAAEGLGALEIATGQHASI